MVGEREREREEREEEESGEEDRIEVTTERLE